MKTLLINLSIFIVLLIIVEIILRLLGFTAGTAIPNFKLVDQVEERQPFEGTHDSITVFSRNPGLFPQDYVINEQGFLSKFNFTQNIADSLQLNDSIPQVFLVGDSYTQGCCTSVLSKSFAHQLQSTYRVFNFGVGGADLVQYKLILQKYLPILNPDVVVIPLYLGNDITADIRTPRPHIPIIYKVQGTFWLNSELPSYLNGLHNLPYFTSAQEAYDFYRKTFTLWGNDRSLWEQLCSKSVVLTYIFKSLPLKIRGQISYFSEFEKNKEIRVTQKLIGQIQDVCKDNGVEVLFCPIPSPQNTLSQVPLDQSYAEHFKNTRVCFPTVSKFDITMYDETEHFNDTGHHIYATEIRSCLDHFFKSKAASLAK